MRRNRQSGKKGMSVTMKIENIPEAFSVTLRLKIITALVSSARTFKELREITQATQGNLSVQLTKLEEWGYLTSEKMIEKKKTKSTYTITEFGLQQFEAYVSLLQSVLQK